MKYIDLRSDTVTKPSQGMLEAMMKAEVGDDVFGEDPTVNKLQERVAGMFGKEAALFVPSGVMGNQVSIKVHTQPGDEILLDQDSHIFVYETGASAFLSGVQMRSVMGVDGTMTSKQ
ncbi:MAG: low specificity L-threonine aldolase, partial [Ignavibacteriae bacterium]|nr:low specificity L-threonine aldolase [Ignavibacteriota bacterium]